MISDLLEENQDLRKQVEELKDEIATRNGKLAILISENERLKGIVLYNEEEISDLEKSCDETQELLDKQIEATYKLDKENAELKLKLEALEGQTPWKDIKDKSEVIGQLTNAKEIIKDFVDNAKILDKKDVWTFPTFLMQEAGKFLSEVEK